MKKLRQIVGDIDDIIFEHDPYTYEISCPKNTTPENHRKNNIRKVVERLKGTEITKMIDLLETLECELVTHASPLLAKVSNAVLRLKLIELSRKELIGWLIEKGKFTKEEFENHLLKLTQSEEEFLSFLKTSSNLHKYPFHEQLAVYMQNPNAKAVASYDTWNKVGRYVRRGSKGIAVRDEDKWKYVFDVSDTSRLAEKTEYKIWEMKTEHTDTVLSSLETEYGADKVSDSTALDRLEKIIEKMIEERFEDDFYYFNENDFADSHFEDLDELNRREVLKETLLNTCLYTVSNRLQLKDDDLTSRYDFSKLWNFNDDSSIFFLCETAQNYSATILRQVEKEISNFEKNKSQNRLASQNDIVYNKDNVNALKREIETKEDTSHEQSKLQTRGRLSDSRSGLGAGHERHREIRRSTQELSDGEKSNEGAENGDARRTDTLTGGYQPPSLRDERADDGRKNETKPSSRQADTASRVDSTLQHAPTRSRRSNTKRPGIQLTPQERERLVGGRDALVQQLSFFPTEEQQKVNILKAEDEKSSAFFIPDETSNDIDREIDTIKTSKPYHIGNTVYIENREFVINHLDTDVVLHDVAFPMLNRSLSHDEFNRLLSADTRNHHLSIPDARDLEADTPLKNTELDTEEGYSFIDGLRNNVAKDSEYAKREEQNLADHNRELEEQRLDDTKKMERGKAENYTITDDNLGLGGLKTKFAFNASAIALLAVLEKENRVPTKAEQETLSKYVGFGGIPGAFDERNEKWEKEYALLKELLSETEYSSAKASTLNAFYTNPTVVKAMYEALGNMGFSKGNILEPAMATGNFFGLMPDSMKESKLYGVELDSISGRIAKQLPTDPSVKNFSYTLVDDKLYFRENSKMLLVEKNSMAMERIKVLIPLRDITRELLSAQLDGISDENLAKMQNRLNDLYDSFTKKFGVSEVVEMTLPFMMTVATLSFAH